jgi:hypothetical protein
VRRGILPFKLPLTIHEETRALLGIIQDQADYRSRAP